MVREKKEDEEERRRRVRKKKKMQPQVIRTVLKNQDSVWVPPIVLAAACRAPPITLLLSALGAVTVLHRIHQI